MTKSRMRSVPCSGRAAVLAVALLGLASCTSEAPDTAPVLTENASTDQRAPEEALVVPDAADDDACGLLPADRVREVLGEELEAMAVPSGGWTAGQCAWSGESSGFILSVGTETSIAAFGDPQEPDAQAKFDSYAERQAEGAERVDDIGDGAVVDSSGAAARVGGAYLELEFLTISEAHAAKDLIRLAADSLRS